AWAGPRAADQTARRTPRAVFSERHQPQGDARSAAARALAQAVAGEAHLDRRRSAVDAIDAFEKKDPYCVPRNGPIGAGVKHNSRMISAATASVRRVLLMGSSSSSVGGWCGPSSSIIATVNVVHTTQLSEKKVRPIATTIITMLTTVERRPNTA